MKKDCGCLNGSTGYGHLTNLVRMEQVYMIRHNEGVGTTESPVREIRSFFDKEGKLICRDDSFRKKSSAHPTE